ncbi:glutathione peroxidase [Aquabacterium sp.]|uniref:glutathione peroxidase n=1 Tax=Aquabacterium sp. TaxID=1872578 RepID=UPI0040382704
MGPVLLMSFRRSSLALLMGSLSWGAQCAPTVQPVQVPPTASPGTSSPAPAPAACPALLNKTFPRLQDEKPQSLCQYSGQVLLVVNTASYCGFTKQFKGLEALYVKYKDKGLVVLGFPSNDFGSQEPGTAKEIADFCANTYGVKFPMFAKSHVVGDEANPLHAELRKATGTRPKWNFYKYLIGRDGQAVQAYSSMTSPDDRDLIEDIEKQLAAKK